MTNFLKSFHVAHIYNLNSINLNKNLVSYLNPYIISLKSIMTIYWTIFKSLKTVFYKQYTHTYPQTCYKISVSEVEKGRIKGRRGNCGQEELYTQREFLSLQDMYTFRIVLALLRAICSRFSNPSKPSVSVHPEGFEPPMTVPKTVVISISPWVHLCSLSIH